ncbi:hypothetical protein CHS0354_012897 [Potamilus streckersoni]|uniref:Uncharacterized protein n=1 Tax=Potamilus streckersoni TaxID=2493646 RepID=A0AAE0SBH4_9BIVA|nr:hypothetical protein CHS0354_012897 [Potamilus streckersoni]
MPYKEMFEDLAISFNASRDICRLVKNYDASAGDAISVTPESSNNLSTTKDKDKSTRGEKSYDTSIPSCSKDSLDSSDYDWVCNTESDSVASNISDSESKVLQASAGDAISVTPESTNNLTTTKDKDKSTRGEKSYDTSIPSCSKDSLDSSDYDWVCKTESDAVASNINESENKVEQDSEDEEISAKDEHKSTRGRKLWSTNVPSYRVPSSDSSVERPSGRGIMEDSEGVCKIKPDDVPSNKPDTMNKNVLAKASKGKSAAKKHKDNIGTTDSTGGGKSSTTSVSSCSVASSEPPDINLFREQAYLEEKMDQYTVFLQMIQGICIKTVGAKAGPANATRKWNSRMSPTKHKYKSVLKKRKRVSTNRLDPNVASGSGSTGKASDVQVSSFIDQNYWKKTEMCCGIIFMGENGEAMLDINLYKPCKARCNKQKPVNETPQRNQSPDDTNINSSISSPNEGETDLLSASTPSITDTDCKKMDA